MKPNIVQEEDLFNDPRGEKFSYYGIPSHRW